MDIARGAESAEKGHYQSLASLGGSSETFTPRRICIVTPDLIGPVKNGGIGTACSHLAHALAEAGHDTTVLFTKGGAHSSSGWERSYEQRGVKVSQLDIDWDSASFWPELPEALISLRAYEWLREQPAFDLVLFMDWRANGFYTLHARKSGPEFANTSFAIVLHSPSLWHLLNNGAMAVEPAEACLWHMERQCLSMADAVISPSAYMLDWCLEHGWKLPANKFVQPNLLTPLGWEQGSRTLLPDEIVFFGRLEYRKGLAQFCAALDILAREGGLPAKITFLGKFGTVGKEHSLVYLTERARKWPESEVRFLANYSSQQAIEYLKSRNALAVIPSISENSPYTVYECLAEQIPVLARDSGGTAELVSSAGRDRVLFGDRPQELAQRLSENLAKGSQTGFLAFELDSNRDAWVRGLGNLPGSVKEKAIQGDLPMISVCLAHHDRPEFLELAIQSLLNQSYSNFEVILVDDGSETRESVEALSKLEPVFSSRGWRIIRSENRYVGHARNIAAREAAGDWLLFFDDDNIARPGLLEECAQAAQRCKSGLISIMFDIFKGSGMPAGENTGRRFLPIGDVISYSTIHNAISDATALVSRESFLKAGGFTEDYGVGHEDFELYLRMALAGEPVNIIPRPLFWYRQTENAASMLAHTNSEANRMRSLRPFMETLSPGLAELALLTQSMATRDGYYISADENPAMRFKGDPTATRSLEDILQWMEKNDRPRFVPQVLTYITFEDYVDLIPRLEERLMHCRTLASTGDYAALESELAAMLGMLEKAEEQTRDCFMADFCAYILKETPETPESASFRARLIARLSHSSNRKPGADLVLAGRLLQSDPPRAYQSFFQALEKAEERYLENRPDVATAIQKGMLRSALHHYALCGKDEGMCWPWLRYFTEAVALFSQRGSELAVVYASLKNMNQAAAESILASLASEAQTAARGEAVRT